MIAPEIAEELPGESAAAEAPEAPPEPAESQPPSVEAIKAAQREQLLADAAELSKLTKASLADETILWACSCGDVMPFGQLGPHVRSRKEKYPECRGAATRVSRQQPPPDPPEPPPLPRPDERIEYRPGNSADPEEQARQMRERLARQRALLDGLGGGGEGNGDGDDGFNPPPGLFDTTPPGTNPDIETGFTPGALPAIFEMYYDWAKRMGWGGTSKAAFVTDFLLEHFQVCLHRGVFVMDYDDIHRLDDQTKKES